MTIKNILFPVFLLLICSVSKGQDIKADFQKMYDEFLLAKSIQLTMDIKVYTGDILFFDQEASIKKELNEYLYTFDQTTMLVNKKYVLMLNDAEKIIVVDKTKDPEKSEKINLNELMYENFDTLVQQYDSWTYNGQLNGVKHYTIHKKNQYINRMDLFLDANNHNAFKKVIYYYNDKLVEQNSKVVVDFKGVKVNEPFPNSTFSEEKFIVKQKERWVAIPRYENYELIEVPHE